MSARLANWMRQQMTDGKVTRFVLRHLAAGARKGSDVFTCTPPSNVDAGWIEKAADDLNAAAEADAEGIASGPQRYVVLPFGEDPARATGRHTLHVAAPELEDETQIESEPANAQGLTAQLMRHMEAKERLQTNGMATVIKSMQKMAESVAAENEQLRAYRLESLAVVESLLSQQAERELAAKQAEVKIEMMQGVAKDLKLLVPPIVNRIAGKSILPSSDPKVLVAKGILESLTEEQRSKLAEMVSALELTPKQQLALGELLQSLN